MHACMRHACSPILRFYSSIAPDAVMLIQMISHGLPCNVCLQITQDGYKFISMGCSCLATIILNELPGLRDECIQV